MPVPQFDPSQPFEIAPKGLLAPGNIDLSTRPRVKNPDGSTSTIRSMSFGQDGKEVLIPTVVDGRVVSDDEAIAAYKKTGQHLGIFSSPAAATAFAQRLHEAEAAKLTAAPAFDPTKPFTDAQPDFRTTNEPPSFALRSAAAAKNLGVAALNTLPALGAAAGGALATPETAGAGTIAGAALGAGAGRGLRDLITQGLGLEPPTSPAAKGGAIALDTAETGVASAVLPGLWEAIRTPGRTAGEVYELARGMLNRVPNFLRVELPPLPKGVAKAPAWILERPAWQTWEQHLPADTPPPAPPPRTGTSMVPTALPTGPVAPVATAPPALTLVPKPAAAAMPPPAAAANALPDQKALNEAALAARRAAYQARQAAAIVPTSGKMRFTADEMKAFAALRKKGLSLADAEAAVKAMRTLAKDLPTTAEAQAAIAARGYKR